MSSSARHCSQANLIARWMPCRSRAGVILRPCPDVAPPVERQPRSASPGPDDSFSANFGPLPASADSSCVAPEPLHLHTDMELHQEGPEQQRNALEELTAQEQDVALVMKLEQLRQWQQHVQQQLRAQQLQELLHLQQEQHGLLGLVSPHHSDEQPQNQSSGLRLSDQQQEHEESCTVVEIPTADRPIRPGSSTLRTFEEMLEEQLRQEKRLKCVNPPQSVPEGNIPLARPKKAFLKKGEGLLRFTNQKADIHKNRRPPVQATAITCCSSKPVSVEKGQSSCGPMTLVQRKTATVSQEHRLTTSLRHQTKAAHIKSKLQLHAPQSHTVQKLKERAPKGPQKEARDTQEWWFQERMLLEPPPGSWESAQQEESVELGEFELLEQAAEELSFSSNSSFVLKVLQMDRQKQFPAEGLHQRRLSSTPVKTPPDPPDPSSHGGPAEGGPTEGGPQQSSSLCESQEEPTKEQVPSGPSVYMFPCQSEPMYNKYTYEDHSLSPSDTADSDHDDCTMTENPQRTSKVLFDDHDTWSQLSPEQSVTVDSPVELASPAERVAKVVEQEAQSDDPPPSHLMSRLFPALGTFSHNAPVMAPPTAAEPPSAPPTTHTQQAQFQLFRERLVELEVQIQHFKKESAALAKVQKDNHIVQDELRRERSEFEQMKAQEMNRFEEYKQEETRKLQRERKLFEKHMSAARAVPNKSEREEIQALKRQLSSVQEELKRKESRWANTHSRLRQQLEALGQDNSSLREEVNTLEKLRITAWKKNSTDTNKTSAAKGVKFAIPLDSSSSSLNSPPALATRGSRRASAPGGTVGTKGIMSSLRRPSLTVGTVEETEPEDQNQSNLSPKEVHGCPGNSQSELHPEQDCERRLQGPQEEVPLTDGKVEQVSSSGARLIVFPNGTKKEVSSDGKTLKVTFFNGDTKEVTADQRVIYHYAEARTTHITYPGGLEVLHFPNNQTEKHFPDGRKEITFPDQAIKNLYPNGQEESILTDGTIIQVHPDGSKEIHFNTGQKEVHTAEYKRRVYPDGTVKTVYSDGRQETCYPTGRLRIKDKEGHVILDKP